MTRTIEQERPAIAAPGRRTRPRGLSALHQEQIEDSRQRILAAAERAFTRNSYNATPVDTIISIAGVSRATFYKYFNSKFDVARGLIQAFMPRLNAVFDALPDRPSPAEAQQWLGRLLTLYEENRQATTLFGEVSGSEPEFFPQMIAFHDGLLAHLGQRIPAFAKAASGRPEHARVHVVAHLCIQHLFAFCTNVVSKNWDIDADAGARYLAVELSRFIAENE
jgi:AcrR family transcriptional regulator